MTELDIHTLPQTIEAYLRQQKWIQVGDRVLGLEKPGEGNMNVVVRVKMEKGSLILKQSRPYVQKYPQIAAPIERVQVESRFYELAGQNSALDAYLPDVIGFDLEQYTFALQDLGAGADYTFLYQKEAEVPVEELEAAVQFLYLLHSTSFSDEDIRHFPDNMALRKLNHEHLIIYPYLMDNGFDLDTVQEGLQQTSLAYKTDETLKKRVAKLGEIYLSAGPTLLHGDYYPGSWLQVDGAFKVIDPEFCFFGRAEYDYGVMVAHFKMAQLPTSSIEKALSHYPKGRGFNEQLAAQFTGMEILRRPFFEANTPVTNFFQREIQVRA